MRTVDAEKVTRQYRIERSRQVLTITKKSPDEGEKAQVTRRYATEHAAVCAFSRVDNDPAFADILYRSMLRQALGLTHRKRKQAVRLNVEHCLMAALDCFEPDEDDDPDTYREKVTDELIEVATDKLKAGVAMEGIGALRKKIAAVNKKLVIKRS